MLFLEDIYNNVFQKMAHELEIVWFILMLSVILF